MLVGGLGSFMEDAGLSGGTERLICLGKMLDLNVMENNNHMATYC